MPPYAILLHKITMHHYALNLPKKLAKTPGFPWFLRNELITERYFAVFSFGQLS